MHFYKYHGTGNDFIIIDDRSNKINITGDEIKSLCNRNFGIGSDGLLILKNHENFDFEMKFYNPDGSEATFCGNGARCIVAFARFLGIIENQTTFIAKDGQHSAFFDNDEVVLKMQNVDIIKKYDNFFYLNTGTPHSVVFVDDVEKIDLVKEALPIRYNKLFQPNGTNVNFVQIFDNYIKVRTYEKGVENETLSCGTGVVASALVSAMNFFKNIKSLDVVAKGGKLNVSFEHFNEKFVDVYLKGNAVKVFEGEISLMYDV